MTIRKLASLIAKREGKKSQARVGDIREILSILADLFYESATDLSIALYDLGFSRSKKKRAKKRRG